MHKNVSKNAIGQRRDEAQRSPTPIGQNPKTSEKRLKKKTKVTKTTDNITERPKNKNLRRKETNKDYIGKSKQKSRDKKECKKHKLKRRKRRRAAEKIEIRLADGAVIQKENDCYVIVKKLGKGAFAAVYEAKRSSDKASVAVKVEFFHREKEHRIPQECQVYIDIEARRLLNPSDKHISHFLRFYDHLQNDLAEFLILQRAGESIESISAQNDPTFTTAIQWAIQALEALEHLHLLGCIHRDIKAANFIISDDKRILYVIDFGMAVKFVRDSKKMPRASVYEFIGTAKYASRTAHNGMPQARRDDVESWLYLVMEFFKHDILPWRLCDNEKINRKKKEFIEGTGYRELFSLLPRGFQSMVGVVRETTVMEEPNYKFFYAVLRWIAEERQVDLTKPFQWNYVGRRSNSKHSELEVKSRNEPVTSMVIDARKKQKTIQSVLDHSRQEEPLFPKAKLINQPKPSA